MNEEAAAASVQHKVILPGGTVSALEIQGETLGFVSANALSAVWLTACSDVPPSQVWAVLAAIRRTHPAKKGKRHV